MTLACEDAYSKLVEVVTVADVDDENRVGNSLLQIWKLTFGPKNVTSLTRGANRPFRCLDYNCGLQFNFNLAVKFIHLKCENIQLRILFILATDFIHFNCRKHLSVGFVHLSCKFC